MKKILVILVFIPFISSAQSTNKIMNSALESYVKLIPYISDEMKFTDPSEEEKINSYITELYKSFKNAKHTKINKDMGFKPSYETIKSHLSETQISFTKKNKFFARTRLKATASLCMSCHTQMKSSGGNFTRALSKISRGDFKSEYDYAEFLFLIRKYVKAKRYYLSYIDEKINENHKVVSSNKGINLREGVFDQKILNAFQRVITIDTKTYYRPQKSLSLIESYLNNKKVSRFVLVELKEWARQLKKWNNKKVKEIRNSKDLDGFITSYLASYEDDNSYSEGSRDIDLLISSGFLVRYLRLNPSKQELPKVLYWLSISERQLNFNLFYSLADIYLKDCITKFPKNSYAKKCYKEYEDSIKMGFTGSAGTSIPNEIKRELVKLKESISNE